LFGYNGQTVFEMSFNGRRVSYATPKTRG
jgi:hypothetical protein